jgi:hypothetical protein
MNDRDDDEFSQLSDEAKADAAPVAEAPYVPRAKWRPGPCLGFIVNTSTPVARLRWPRGREVKDFLARVTR